MRHPALLLLSVFLLMLIWTGVTLAPPTSGGLPDRQIAAPPATDLAAVRAPLPTATLLPTATSSPLPTPDPAFAALEYDLHAMVATWPGEHAVSLADLQTGHTISVNGRRPQLAACTIKIPIMVAVAHDIEAGHYTEADVAGLVQSAMGPSNTAPARELLRITGGGDIGVGIRRANQIMAGLGASQSLMTHPPGYYWEEYGYAGSHASVDNLLTSDDLVRMLSAIYRGEALSPRARGYVLQSMAIAPDWMDASFGSPLPADVQLYHKVGQLYGPHHTWNDAGIVVFRRDGQEYAYALAYLGSYGHGWQDAYAHAMSVSERAWNYFSNAALPTPVPTVPPIVPPTHPAPPQTNSDLTGYAVAAASSVRPPQILPDGTFITYHPGNILDRNPASVWMEHVAGTGQAEWLRLTFPVEVIIARIDLQTGLDGDDFTTYNRPRRLRLRFSEGTITSIELLDQPGIQTIILVPVTTTSLDILIDEVYPGITGNTALAGVMVWGGVNR